MTLLPDLAKLTDVRLAILYDQKLAAIDRIVNGHAELRRLCSQADKVEDELNRRALKRDKDKAP